MHSSSQFQFLDKAVRISIWAIALEKVINQTLFCKPDGFLLTLRGFKKLTKDFRLYGTQTWAIKWSAVSSKQRSCWYWYMDALHECWLNGWRKKLDGDYTRMLLAILNMSWRQHPKKQQVYGHLPPITKTIQVRRTRHAGHCWRSRDELVSYVLLWTPSYGRAKAGRPTRTYIQ